MKNKINIKNLSKDEIATFIERKGIAPIQG